MAVPLLMPGYFLHSAPGFATASARPVCGAPEHSLQRHLATLAPCAPTSTQGAVADRFLLRFYTNATVIDDRPTGGYNGTGDGPGKRKEAADCKKVGALPTVKARSTPGAVS